MKNLNSLVWSFQFFGDYSAENDGSTWKQNLSDRVLEKWEIKPRTRSLVDSASWGNKSHCVDYDNIKLSDIYRYSSEEFLRVRGCGIATVAELAAILRKYNVIPPGDLAKWDRIDTH